MNTKKKQLLPVAHYNPKPSSLKNNKASQSVIVVLIHIKTTGKHNKTLFPFYIYFFVAKDNCNITTKNTC